MKHAMVSGWFRGDPCNQMSDDAQLNCSGGINLVGRRFEACALRHEMPSSDAQATTTVEGPLLSAFHGANPRACPGFCVESHNQTMPAMTYGAVAMKSAGQICNGAFLQEEHTLRCICIAMSLHVGTTT